MKKIILKLLLICTSVVSISLFVVGCDYVSDVIGADKEENALEHAQRHTDPNYVCPMHPQVTDNKVSSCPICGMDLELRAPMVRHSSSSHSTASETAVEHAALHLAPNYVCPMHAQITDSKQSACPICGMDLELRENPQQSGRQSGESDAVFVSAAMINNLGVRLQHVELGQVAEQVYASGFVEKVSVAQEENILSKVSGRLHSVAVKPGQWVELGDVLLSIEMQDYYPTVVDYMDAMENVQITKALELREKLIAMGAGDAVLAGYEEEGPLSKNLEIVAPFSGEISWVIDKSRDDSSADENTVEIGTRLVHIAAPALAEVGLRSYSRLARGVKVGHTGELGVAHLPGRTWPGRVVEVIHNRSGFYSALQFHVMLPYGLLEPGAFAGAYVNAGTANDVMRIATSAVIYDESSTRVVRLQDDESFQVVEVVLGFEGHKWVEVVSGLEQGDHVVTRGQFLIDSEATLQAGFKRISNE